MLKELKRKEKLYFDTYKNNRTNIDKANHLIAMANIIMEIDRIEKDKSNENCSNNISKRR